MLGERDSHSMRQWPLRIAEVRFDIQRSADRASLRSHCVLLHDTVWRKIDWLQFRQARHNSLGSQKHMFPSCSEIAVEVASHGYSRSYTSVALRCNPVRTRRLQPRLVAMQVLSLSSWAPRWTTASLART